MPLTVTISRAPISCQQFPCVTSSPYGASARQVLWCTDLWLYDYIHLWDPKFKSKSLSKYYIPSSGPRSLQVQSAFHQSGRVSSLWAVSLTKSSLMSLPCPLLCNLIRNKAFPHSSGLLICPLTPGCSQSTSSRTCGLRTPARNRYCPIRMSLLLTHTPSDGMRDRRDCIVYTSQSNFHQVILSVIASHHRNDVRLLPQPPHP